MALAESCRLPLIVVVGTERSGYGVEGRLHILLFREHAGLAYFC